MSTEDCKPFQLQSTDAAVWENSKENATSLPLKSKLSDRSTTNRPVLKTIGLVNQNIGRVQPFRAAKQNSTKEGFFSSHSIISTSKSVSDEGVFKIFNEESAEASGTSDEKNPEASASSKSKLPSAVTSLPVCRIPLRTLQAKDNTPVNLHESPMVLDVSEEERLNIFDIDNEDGVFGLSEYAVEIFEHLRKAELRHRPKPNYMRKQQDITPGMRCILVDWLVEVADEYRLHNETLHLAVNYLDRFLSQMAVLRGKLQLVGTATMFIASKFEEIYPPDVGEYVYITDDTYTKKQVLRMEHLILKVLNFDVAVPTSNQFLKRFSKAAKADSKTEFLAQYLCELALLDLELINYLPSAIAAAAVSIASYTVAEKLWDETMEFHMKFSLDELRPCMKKLHKMFQEASTTPQQAIYEKYKDAKFDCVATLTPPSSLPFNSDSESEKESA